MRCSCAALAALTEALLEALERGTSPDGRKMARNVVERLADNTMGLYDKSIARCARESGCTPQDVEDCLEYFVAVGGCRRDYN